ncbi:MAG: hypothetical protein UT29_C0001G0014 [Candidatus Yanofskybacteria bacterium GW2011_GWA1_39_13]|uniref:DUF11 domain-containing protein n=1 Tax=Yanofskybacteria sp. (strain GW2011_GWA1_39_13) TaxID=1619019 RepID=A0A0G0MEN0_YANXG|nr:MAG: hypothetical protein UT29_C0001G0014 [Candidatus Yanofskybacteria bacterium GW2011_GWA1_39_13]
MQFLYNYNQLLKWLVLLALLLAIVSFLSFWFGSPSFSESGVKLDIEGPTQVMVGDEVVYKLKYSNTTKLDLSSMRFKFTYPDSSVVLKDGIVSTNLSETFTIDQLSPGQEEVKEFKAFLVGDRGNIKTAKVELAYRAGDLRTAFEKTTSVSTTIIGLPVALTLAAPPNSVPGQSISYVLDYRNETSDDIYDLRFEFDYPEGFSVQKLTPTPSTGNYIWNVPVLKKSSGGRISITGPLSGKEGETKNVSVVLKRKIGEQYVDYEKAETSSTIASSLLGTEILVNDSADYSAFAGDDLNYTIKYANSSNYNLVGVNLTVKLEGEMYDISSLDTKGGYYDNSNGTILWNASSVPDFSNLSPNKKGQISFRIKLKNSIPSGATGSKNLFVRASARLSTPNVPSNVGGDEIFAESNLVTKISTQPTLKQVVYYNDLAFGSSGPLPPEVGKETSLTIHWQITNPGNDMSGVKISGILPAGVIWKNIVSVGSGQPEPSYNKNTSEVVWNLGVLPQGVGVTGAKYEASFQVTIKPSLNQKGSTILLVKDSKLSGIDSFTKQNIIVPVRDITTNDMVDRPNEGIVK